VSNDDLETTIAYARALYEGTHGMTITQLSEITQIAPRTLKIYSSDQKWKKELETKTGATTQSAIEAAAHFSGQQLMREKEGEEAPAEDNALVEPLPSERDELLTRHKAEWKVPRAMANESVNLRTTNPMAAFERAKMAKITAESLKIIQDGERRAYGIDKPDGDHTLLLQRT
jgi:hypothetical protein